MKLSECIKFQLTGICKVDIDNVCKCFGKTGMITRNKNKWRLINTRAGVKVEISEYDALQIIDQLNLDEFRHGIFTNVIMYYKTENN